MKVVRKTVDGVQKDLYLVDDAGNEIRGITAFDDSVVYMEVFEGNFDLLLNLIPSNGMVYFTKEAIEELAQLIYDSRNVAEKDALLFVEIGIDKILRKQGRPGNELKISSAKYTGRSG